MDQQHNKHVSSKMLFMVITNCRSIEHLCNVYVTKLAISLINVELIVWLETHKSCPEVFLPD